MKKIIGILILFGQCMKAFFGNIKNITTKKDCFWTINETFFIGENAKIRRDNFQREYNELVGKYKYDHVEITTTGNIGIGTPNSHDKKLNIYSDGNTPILFGNTHIIMNKNGSIDLSDSIMRIDIENSGQRSFDSIECPSNKLELSIRPHGDNCGCDLADRFSPGLGCPNPNCKLIITSDNIVHVESKPIGNSKPMKKLKIGSTDWVGSNTCPSTNLHVIGTK